MGCVLLCVGTASEGGVELRRLQPQFEHMHLLQPEQEGVRTVVQVGCQSSFGAQRRTKTAASKPRAKTGMINRGWVPLRTTTRQACRVASHRWVKTSSSYEKPHLLLRLHPPKREFPRALLHRVHNRSRTASQRAQRGPQGRPLSRRWRDSSNPVASSLFTTAP